MKHNQHTCVLVLIWFTIIFLAFKEIAYCLSQFASEIYIDREGQRDKWNVRGYL